MLDFISEVRLYSFLNVKLRPAGEICAGFRASVVVILFASFDIFEPPKKPCHLAV